MAFPLKDSSSHTYGEYLRRPDSEVYELLDGTAYAMSPAPTRTHQRMVAEIFRQIADALESTTCEPNLAPFDVRLPEGDEVDDDISTVVQPDIVVVCDRAKLDERGCRGAPDWIIEVVSPGSAAHDQITKLALYERHRVREYWIVHPGDGIVTAYRANQDGAYGRPEVRQLSGAQNCHAVARVTIDWERVLARIK